MKALTDVTSAAASEKNEITFCEVFAIFFLKIFKRSSKALLVRIHSLDITYVIIFSKYNFVTDLLAG